MKIIKSASPLRYPGGKTCLTGFIADVAKTNDLIGGTYLEPYAGGAGAGLNLLINETFSRIHINDFDHHIYLMWDNVLNNPEEFVKKIENTNITIEEWHKQKYIFQNKENFSPIEVGFSAFFLNRTNRSGIIYKAGPIGGLQQNGTYKIDCRFNKIELIKRIELIQKFNNKITLTNLDAIELIKRISFFHKNRNEVFTYLDPPYFNKGKFLYLNNYDYLNHKELSSCIAENMKEDKWIISYDNTEEIIKMYPNFRKSTFDLNYTLQSKKYGSELLIFSNTLKLSGSLKVNKRIQDLILF